MQSSCQGEALIGRANPGRVPLEFSAVDYTWKNQGIERLFAESRGKAA
jgi:hypothetical protein